MAKKVDQGECSEESLVARRAALQLRLWQPGPLVRGGSLMCPPDAGCSILPPRGRTPLFRPRKEGRGAERGWGARSGTGSRALKGGRGGPET